VDLGTSETLKNGKGSTHVGGETSDQWLIRVNRSRGGSAKGRIDYLGSGIAGCPERKKSAVVEGGGHHPRTVQRGGSSKAPLAFAPLPPTPA